MPLHLEILTPEARALWPRLPACSEGYYLAGGTALALQLGHRVSVDLDFFTDGPIPRSKLAKVEGVFKGHHITPSINNRDELTLLADGVKLSFICYPFPLLMPLVHADGIDFLSPAEIAVTKAYTIGRRGQWKDYVDLFACLSGDVTTLSEVIEHAQKKYGEGFNDRLLLEQLAYFDDLKGLGELQPKIPVSPESVRAYFAKAIADLHLAG